MNTNIQQGLQQALADTYSLMVKTHVYHWNVTGLQFMVLHQLFQTQYEALFEAADTLAERVRQLGAPVDGGIERFVEITNIEAPKASHAISMVVELAEDHRAMSKSLVSFARLADEAGDRVTADLLTVRAAEHDKNAWMLTAQLPEHHH